MEEVSIVNVQLTQWEVGHGSLELLYRSAAASHFVRPGKSAAAAITLSTQRVNEHQIESLQQTNNSYYSFMPEKWF